MSQEMRWEMQHFQLPLPSMALCPNAMFGRDEGPHIGGMATPVWAASAPALSCNWSGPSLSPVGSGTRRQASGAKAPSPQKLGWKNTFYSRSDDLSQSFVLLFYVEKHGNESGDAQGDAATFAAAAIDGPSSQLHVRL